MKDLSEPILRANALHAPLMAEIHKRAFPPREVWDEVALRQQLCLPGTFALVHSAGFLLTRVVAGEAEILTFAVVPAAQRQGLGRALLTRALCDLAGLGAATIYLEVAEHNHPARALYASAGAATIGRRRAYYPDGGDALVYRFLLSLRTDT
jgi:ribosomal-protein-alanine N-acetyltransferase